MQTEKTSPQETDAASQSDPNWPRNLDTRLERLGKIDMDVTVLLGRIQLPLEALLELNKGSILETRKLSGQPMDILVNETPFGRGEIIVLGDHLAVRITELFKPQDMLNR